MAKKTKGFPIWVWIIIALLVVVVLSQKEIIDLPLIPGTIIPPLEVATTPTRECSLKLDKYLVNPGDSVTGTIQDGIFANCDVYIKFSGIWANVGTYQTDDTGEFSYEINAPAMTGTYEIIAICDDKGESCKTNTEVLTVTGVIK